MKWKERMGLALSGALIGLTLLLIVDVHYRISNGQLTPPGEAPNFLSGNAETSGGNSGQAGGSATGKTVPTVLDGGGEIGRSPSPVVGGDTAENQYANSRLTNGARMGLIRNQRDNDAILVKHDKVQYAQPNNLSNLVAKSEEKIQNEIVPLDTYNDLQIMLNPKGKGYVILDGVDRDSPTIAQLLQIEMSTKPNLTYLEIPITNS